MTFVIWSEFLSVGVAEIDEQHKQLVQLINSLYHHIQVGNDKHIIGSFFDRLVEYTDFHFSTEERLMEHHVFPNSSDHIHEHKQFIASATGLQQQINSNYADIKIDAISVSA